MDAHVDIKVLNHERDSMQEEIKRLERIVDMLNQTQSKASLELEGNQFDIAAEEISSLTNTIDNTILHFNLLITQIDKMIDDVTNYVNSAYGGK